MFIEWKSLTDEAPDFLETAVIITFSHTSKTSPSVKEASKTNVRGLVSGYQGNQLGPGFTKQWV